MRPAAQAIPGRYEKVLALSIAALALLIHLPLIDLPFERDEGEYAYIAWRMDFGEVPYLDWFDQKAPGIFWAYRLALALPGDPVTAVHGVAALFSACSAAALFLLALRLVGAAPAAVGAALFAWISADPLIQGTAANTEIFMLLPIILANLLFLQVVEEARPPPLRTLLVGLLVGLGVAFKQVAAVNAVFFLLAYPLLARGQRRPARLARFVGWTALGVALVWLPILASFQARGALEAMIDATFLHNLSYVGGSSLSTRIENLVETLAVLRRSQGVAWVLGLVGFVFLARGGRYRSALYLGGWALFSAVGVSASGQFFPHYFQQLLPPIAIAAGVAVKEIHDAPEWGRVPSWIRKTVMGGIAFAPPAAIAVSFWLMSPTAAVRQIFPGNNFDMMPAVAQEIASVTAPDDTVFIFGAEPEILFYAQRRSASRYIYLFPLFGPWPDALDRQRQVAQEVLEASPAAILFMPNASFFAEGNEQYLTRWLKEYVEEDYRLHATVGAGETAQTAIQRIEGGAPRMLEGKTPYGLIFVRSLPTPSD
ncbi:MAG: glycosyltransferase family 39 protein [Deltaproteobacteria bacterium]|nr:glycosyltransferase family 39 protein [Deltaproteobacteria bacterium]